MRSTRPFAGVVGTPRVQSFRVRMTGRIRGSATAPWMPFVAEQHSFFDPPRRYFWMEATRGGVPLAEDGKTLLSQRWSTPVREYRAMGPYRLIAGGEARYAAPSAEYACIELEVHEVSTELVPGHRNGGQK